MNDLRPSNSSVAGFTLIEVLLASFILFIVLAAMTQVYRGALLSSEKAEAALRISGAVPSIHAKIASLMRQTSDFESPDGDGQFGSLRYSWKAKLIHKGEPPLFLQEDFGEDIQFFLWHVDLEVSDKTQTRTYNFTEVSW
jgi:Tfp pilus assembly protein PilV